MTVYVGRIQPAILYGMLANQLGAPKHPAPDVSHYQKDSAVVVVRRLETGSFRVSMSDGKLPGKLEQRLEELNFRPESNGSNGNGHRA